MQGIINGLATQLFISHDRPEEGKMDTIVNRRDWQKPTGGLWTSTWNAENKQSDWLEWCMSEDFDNPLEKSKWLLTPRPDCRIYTIDSLADLLHCIHSEYGYPCSYNDIFAGMYDRYYIDFERMAQDYDAIHLTARGNAETHLSFPNDLNGWDVESTLWFRWCFDEVKLVED